MPLMRRRPLLRAAMVGGAGYKIGKNRERKAEETAETTAPPAAAEPSAGSETDRIDALTKLKALLDSGVLTTEQYESERRRLTEGM